MQDKNSRELILNLGFAAETGEGILSQVRSALFPTKNILSSFSLPTVPINSVYSEPPMNDFGLGENSVKDDKGSASVVPWVDINVNEEKKTNVTWAT